MDLSVIILTFNEEVNIRRCLDALSWCDDIHIVDSGSTDNTVSIANSLQIKILTHEFESFGKQRNYALTNCMTKYNWILFLDADELVTPQFLENIRIEINKADETVAGYYCCWKMMLENRWLKHCDNFPKWQFRILKKGKALFTDFGHGQKEGIVQGKIGYIKEPYLHYAFSKGWTDWVMRHNRYSSLEAKERFQTTIPFTRIFTKNHY